MKRLLIIAAALALVGGGAFFGLTAARPPSLAPPSDHQADLSNGETLFWAGGCASCHVAPDDADADGDLPRLGGGAELATPFGIFRAPNISPDPQHGIGAWSAADFINAMVDGVAPDGRHYYPAFPYPYYRRMSAADLLDLKAFLDRLPPVAATPAGHALIFPFNIRRGLGLWKRRYLSADAGPQAPEPGESEQVQRGRYLVQGPAHCGACHTPRDFFGGEREQRYLAGAQSLELPTEGAEPDWVPNITPHADGIGAWSEADIIYALESGFDPDFDSFGGSMVDVQENMARLPASDRAAIAAYLKQIPALP